MRVDRTRAGLRIVAEGSEPHFVIEATYSGGAEGITFQHHEGNRVRVFSRDEVARHPALAALLRLIADEAESTRAPNQELLGFLFRALRVYVERIDTSNPLPRWGRHLHHPQIERALRLLNRDIEKRWTVDLLARAVGLSRPVFARLFVETVGLSPMRYLTDQRMRVAAALLLESNQALAELARRVGYESEFAFGRAFKRHYGEPPGVFRRSRRAPSRTVTLHAVGGNVVDRSRCAA